MEDIILGKRPREEGNDYEETPIKKRKTISSIVNDATKNFNKRSHAFKVYGTNVRNYMLKDPLLDFIKMYVSTINSCLSVISEQTQLDELFEYGHKFEEIIVSKIKEKCKEFVEMSNLGGKKICPNDSLETMEYMQRGIPIIFQGILFNKKNNTGGIADIIIRSDYINKLFDESILTKEEMSISAPNINSDKYHYCVIDIKCSQLFLCSKSLNIRNSDNIPAYKGQLTIYNFALGEMQGYIPHYAYILGNGWKREVCGIKEHSSNPFNLLGIIDYYGFDINYIEKTKEAIDWYRKLIKEGKKWKLNPPSVSELYPNMCNKLDAPYHAIKKKYAETIDEITLIWKVGIENRNLAHASNIFKWSDPDCCSERLGMCTKTGKLVDKILDINRDSKKLIIPEQIINNDYDWKERQTLDFYIDFETIQSNFVSNESSKIIIFMIGIGYVEDSKFKYKTLSLDKCNEEAEEEMINKFMLFIDEKRKNDERIRLFHWGNIEKTLIMNYQTDKWDSILQFVDFVDMCIIFQKEPIIIKGMKNFGLKEVGKAMYNNKMISDIWDGDEIEDGLTTMFKAIKYYKENNIHTITFNKIIKYNMYDCKVLYEIIEFLRNK